MLFRQLFDNESSTYTYLLADQASKEAVLIDPVIDQVERDLQVIKELGLTLRYAIDTHVHADHVTALGTLRERTGCKTVLSANAAVGCCDIKVSDGDTVTFGQHQLKVLTTPGHTDSCISLYGDGRVFTGDALLIRACGRTDFQQGNSATLYQSVTQKLFTLPADTMVYVGHDYKGRTLTTIAEEMQWNPRLGGGKTQAEFVSIMANLSLAFPKKIGEALPRNLQCGLMSGEVLPSRWAPVDVTTEGVPEVTVDWVAANATKYRLIDVREPDEVRGELGAITNIEVMPLGTFQTQVANLPRTEPLILVCRSGNRSGKAAALATELGFEKVASMRGGMLEWNHRALPIAPRNATFA